MIGFICRGKKLRSKEVYKRIYLPAIVIFQLAMYQLTKSLGVKPDVVMGHSFGELPPCMHLEL